jgi:hypothetical protein
LTFIAARNRILTTDRVAIRRGFPCRFDLTCSSDYPFLRNDLRGRAFRSAGILPALFRATGNVKTAGRMPALQEPCRLLIDLRSTAQAEACATKIFATNCVPALTKFRASTTIRFV